MLLKAEGLCKEIMKTPFSVVHNFPLYCRIQERKQENNNYLDTVNDKPLLSEILTLGEKNKNSAFNLKLFLFCEIKD